jgi:ribosomal protein S18 acetylase RimI-like enzyme
MRVRTATRDDFEAIYRVARASWETDYPEILSRETVSDAVEEWYRSEEFAQELDRPRSLVLVATDDRDDVVGFAHAVWKDESGYVLRLYVTPERRRDGVGRQLLDGTRERLREHDVERVDAMVLSANRLGNEFYRSFGFEAVDEGETVIAGERVPETRYRLDLE